MRFVTYRRGEKTRLGMMLDERTVVDLNEASTLCLAQTGRSPDHALPADMLSLIDGGDESLTLAREAGSYCRKTLAEAGLKQLEDVLVTLDQVRLDAPIPRPRKNIVCLAGNYSAHVTEAVKATGIPFDKRKAAVFFSKPPTAVIGPEDDIELDEKLTQKLDYEGELTVVIGKKGKAIPAERAYDHVFGYTIMNDVSARDLQHLHEQYHIGKGLDTFGPMGPYIVHKSAIADPHDLQLTTRVNGEVRQSANTGEMTRRIPELIATLSAGITLEPGDLICTGTCAGVGHGMDPPQFLKDGDVVEITIAGIGTLRNRVRRTRTAD